MKTRSRIVPHRKEEISDLAHEVASMYCAALPVEPELIATAKNITMSFGWYGDSFDGMLECREERFHIFCNLDRLETRNSPRSRFTLGHELGHFFIDEHRSALLAGHAPAHPSRCEYESKNLVEQEADLFASNLLMPWPRFRAAIGDVKPRLEGVLELAQLFRTSVTSTTIRYAESGLASCAVVKWNAEGFAWKWMSRDLFTAGYRKTIEMSDDLAPDSATGLALSGAPTPSARYFQSGTTASQWFPYVRQTASQNIIFVEQAIPLGRFGVLTLLSPEAGTLAT